MSFYDMPSSILAPENIGVTKLTKIPALMELNIYWKQSIMNKYILC